MRLLGLTLTTLLLAAGCRKNDRPAPSNKMSGIWKGKYSHRYISPAGDTLSGNLVFTYTMIFSENGTMVVYDGDEGATLMATGRYMLQGSKLYGEYAYIRGGSGQFGINALLHRSDSMSGTWHIGYGGQTGGLFWLKR